MFFAEIITQKPVQKFFLKFYLPYTKACAGKALDGAIEAIKKAVKKGDKVALVGFGTFSLTKRKARTGGNPQSGTTIKIAAKKLPKFSAGKAFMDTVNK